MVNILEVWPSAFGAREPSELFRRLRGATIVRIGVPENGNLEGGGLALEYRDTPSSESKYIFLEFNELGMWERSLSKDVFSTS